MATPSIANDSVPSLGIGYTVATSNRSSRSGGTVGNGSIVTVVVVDGAVTNTSTTPPSSDTTSEPGALTTMIEPSSDIATSSPNRSPGDREGDDNCSSQAHASFECPYTCAVPGRWRFPSRG